MTQGRTRVKSPGRPFVLATRGRSAAAEIGAVSAWDGTLREAATLGNVTRQ